MIETDHPLALAVTVVVVLGAIAALELGVAASLMGDGDAEESFEVTGTPSSDDPRFGAAGALTDDDGRLLAEREYDGVPDRIERKQQRFDRAIELHDPTGFINADPFTLSDYVGEKVILVEFWTFGCYNCQNTHPYIKSYWREYEDDGLLVVGVHKPEFDYEKDPENVREYVNETNTTYPVVLDNRDATWDAYDQRAWPTRYLIGVDGFIRYKHRGEGAYNETDRRIRELLAERDRVVNATDGTGG